MTSAEAAPEVDRTLADVRSVVARLQAEVAPKGYAPQVANIAQAALVWASSAGDVKRNPDLRDPSRFGALTLFEWWVSFARDRILPNASDLFRLAKNNTGLGFVASVVQRLPGTVGAGAGAAARGLAEALSSMIGELVAALGPWIVVALIGMAYFSKRRE